MFSLIGDSVINTAKMAMNVMKQYADAFAGGKLASGGDGVNGIALPPGDVLIGTGNDSATAVSSTVSLKCFLLLMTFHYYCWLIGIDCSC